ncbi:MAG: DUF3300 domain-containing protein [Planctomycetes bacterium]|nr:DUF3300 domain-containing protein [Planctomycetota bacterium]
MQVLPHAALLLAALATPTLAAQTAGPAAGRQATQPAPQQPAGSPAAQTGAPGGSASAFSKEQLEQIAAPIALYPDTVLAQVFMASTYPLEVVEAARWREKNPKLAGDALEQALQKFTWDPSVKALCGFADVLKRMNENLDWTQDLGDAFLGQKKELMDAVQVMRRKAVESGSLKSSKELTVSEESGQIIVIEAANPEVVYVPTYYPSAVYGSWGYPYWYYPPLYPPPPAGGAWFGFSVGIIWGAAIWGDCNWGSSDIDIDIDHHHDFVDRTEGGDRRQQVKDRVGERGGAGAKDSKARFQHDAAHRKGVGYRDGNVAQRYGGTGAERRVTRDQARGYGDRSGTRPGGGSVPAVDGGAVSRPGGGSLPAQRPDTGATPRPGGGTLPAQRPASGAGVGTGNRPTSRPTGATSGSFTGSRGTSLDRASSTRGAASRGVSGARGGGGRGGGRR